MMLKGNLCVLLLILSGGPAMSESPNTTYVAIGASDATGIGAFPVSDGYVFRIKDLIENEGMGVNLVNLGIPGAESRQMRRLELPVALLVGPELVTVFAGPNDLVSGESVRSFRSNLNSILRNLSRHTTALVFVANLPDLTQLSRFANQHNGNVTRSRVIAFNQAIQTLAKRYGATLVDLYSQNITEADVAADGFHPSNEGHARIAGLFWQEMQPIFRGGSFPRFASHSNLPFAGLR